MKKVLKKLFSSFLAVSMAFVTVAPVCAKESNVQPTVEPRASIYSVTKTSTIPVKMKGDYKVADVKVTITAEVKDSNGTHIIQSYKIKSDEVSLAAFTSATVVAKNVRVSSNTITVDWVPTYKDLMGSFENPIKTITYTF